MKKFIVLTAALLTLTACGTKEVSPDNQSSHAKKHVNSQEVIKKPSKDNLNKQHLNTQQNAETNPSNSNITRNGTQPNSQTNQNKSNFDIKNYVGKWNTGGISSNLTVTQNGDNQLHFVYNFSYGIAVNTRTYWFDVTFDKEGRGSFNNSDGDIQGMKGTIYLHDNVIDMQEPDNEYKATFYPEKAYDSIQKYEGIFVSEDGYYYLWINNGSSPQNLDISLFARSNPNNPTLSPTDTQLTNWDVQVINNHVELINPLTVNSNDIGTGAIDYRFGSNNKAILNVNLTISRKDPNSSFHWYNGLMRYKEQNNEQGFETGD